MPHRAHKGCLKKIECLATNLCRVLGSRTETNSQGTTCTWRKPLVVLGVCRREVIYGAFNVEVCLVPSQLPLGCVAVAT